MLFQPGIFIIFLFSSLLVVTEQRETYQSVRSAQGEARAAFYRWERRRQQTIKSLKDLQEEMQAVDNAHVKSEIAYNVVGIVGTSLAIISSIFTGGGSLLLLGLAVGTASGAAETVHGMVRDGIISSKVDEAREMLERDGHEFQIFQDKIDVALMVVTRVGQVRNVLRNTKKGIALFRKLRNLKGVVKSSRKMLRGTIFSVASLAFDIKSLVDNVKALQSGELREEARIIQAKIEVLEKDAEIVGNMARYALRY